MEDLQELYEDIKSRVTADGYNLTPVPGTAEQYAITDEDNFVLGELMAGYNAQDRVSSIYLLNNDAGEYNEIASLSDYERIMEAYVAFRDMNRTVETKKEQILVEETHIEADPLEAAEDILGENNAQEIEPEEIPPVEEEIAPDVIANEETVEEAIETKETMDEESLEEEFMQESPVMEGYDIDEREEDTLNITQDMSEREMAAAVVDFVNEGEEMTPEQAEWIDGHSDEKGVAEPEIEENEIPEPKSSDILRQELNAVDDKLSKIYDEIAEDEKKLDSLNRQIDRQFAIAKMNFCPADDLMKMRKTSEEIRDTTRALNDHRKALTETEREFFDKKAELKAAVKSERRDKIHGLFDKGRDILKKGVSIGLGALGWIKEEAEKANKKAINTRETKEKVGAYKDLVKQIDNINKNYTRQMDMALYDYKENVAELQATIAHMERKAEIRGTFKDLGRLLTGKEAEHNYSLTDKERAAIASLEKLVSDSRLEIESLNVSYVQTIAPKLEEQKDFGKAVEDRGRDVGDIFSQRLSRIHKEHADEAKEVKSRSEKVLNGADKDER